MLACLWPVPAVAAERKKANKRQQKRQVNQVLKLLLSHVFEGPLLKRNDLAIIGGPDVIGQFITQGLIIHIPSHMGQISALWFKQVYPR